MHYRRRLRDTERIIMTKKVGIKDIAAMAGVSASTVSKVLKNYPTISEATRERVLAAIEKTGYIPNSVASALSSKNKKRMALYVYINDKFQQIDEINMLYIQGAYDQAREDELELITVFNESIEKLSKEETAQYFHSLYVDTIIVFGLNKNDEKIRYLSQEGRFQTVVVDAVIEGENVSTVMIDHFQGQYDTAEAVVEPGDKVLYLKGRDDGFVTDMRLDGMKKLAEDKKLKLTIEDGGFSEERAYEIVKGLTETYDAIVCASDLMAIGAKRALPEGSTVRIAGFDGIRLMGYAADDVLTCRQDFYRIGAEAVKEAEKLSRGEKGGQGILPYTVTKICR